MKTKYHVDKIVASNTIYIYAAMSNIVESLYTNVHIIIIRKGRMLNDPNILHIYVQYILLYCIETEKSSIINVDLSSNGARYSNDE